MSALVILGGWIGWHESALVHRADFSELSARVALLDHTLASEVATRREIEQQLIMERATRETLFKELAQAQTDAASRQEALVFLESLLTSNDRSRAVRLVACEMQLLEAHQYRYRALLAQGFNSSMEFNGRLVVSVDYLRRGQRNSLVLGGDKPLPVRVRHYERVEGELTLPAEAVPQALDVRILSLDGHQVIAQCHKKIGSV
ncbi:MAG: hypothetical protein P4L87_05140 [Formivibrio sp.]|nr:hypothetical protein [Formivibrio sp.]